MAEANPKYVDAHQLKAWIHDDAELGLLDVRERGQYGENHLFFAVPLPYSTLELDIARLVPNRHTRVAIYASRDSDGAVHASARVLARLGYDNVHILQGGIEAWQQAGYSTFAGVNLPSKTFGELAEHVYGTPRVSAADLYRMLGDKDRNIVVLDGRPVGEFRKMSIPGAVCCPNGELALRAEALAPDPDTTIVVNCAGRTRSIIGAQTLINLGIPNKVYALENGTQGWYLADFPLEHRAERAYPPDIAQERLPALRARSAALATRFALATVTGAEVRRWLAEGQRSVFICDVRTEEEHLASRLPALVQHAPGGQLIQATDQYIGVRKARIVLYDSDGIRAPVAASWLRQLGWEVYLLADLQPLADLPPSPAHLPALRHTQAMDPADVARFAERHPEAMILDARASQDFRQLRLQRASWVIRPNLARIAAGQTDRPILLLGPDREKLELLAGDLEEAGFAHLHLVVVDTDGLKALGMPLASGVADLPDDACIDYLFFVHDRHDGNKDAARKYLEWEMNLVSQLDEQEYATFRIGP